MFLYRDMMASIFKFVDNQPDPVEKLKRVQDNRMWNYEKKSWNKGKNTLNDYKSKNFNIKAINVMDGVSVTGKHLRTPSSISTIANLRGHVELVYRREEKEIEDKENNLLIRSKKEYEKSSSMTSQEILKIKNYENYESNLDKELPATNKEIETKNIHDEKMSENEKVLEVRENIHERDLYRLIYKQLSEKKKDKNRVYPSVIDFVLVGAPVKEVK